MLILAYLLSTLLQIRLIFRIYLCILAPRRGSRALCFQRGGVFWSIFHSLPLLLSGRSLALTHLVRRLRNRLPRFAFAFSFLLGRSLHFLRRGPSLLIKISRRIRRNLGSWSHTLGGRAGVLCRFDLGEGVLVGGSGLLHLYCTRFLKAPLLHFLIIYLNISIGWQWTAEGFGHGLDIYMLQLIAGLFFILHDILFLLDNVISKLSRNHILLSQDGDWHCGLLLLGIFFVLRAIFLIIELLNCYFGWTRSIFNY